MGPQVSPTRRRLCPAFRWLTCPLSTLCLSICGRSGGRSLPQSETAHSAEAAPVGGQPTGVDLGTLQGGRQGTGQKKNKNTAQSPPSPDKLHAPPKYPLDEKRKKERKRRRKKKRKGKSKLKLGQGCRKSISSLMCHSSNPAPWLPGPLQRETLGGICLLGSCAGFFVTLCLGFCFSSLFLSLSFFLF